MDASAMDASALSDGGGNGDVPLGAMGLCRSAYEVALFFREQGCTDCHSGGRSPDLRPSALATILSAPSMFRPGHAIVVPGRPQDSEIYLRLAGPRPTDYAGVWWMPIGATGPNADPSVVANWIMRNAEIDCAGDPGDGGPLGFPDAAPVTDPNQYAQGALFMCPDPSATRSSPARVRRINDNEFSLASGNPVGGQWSNVSVASNPLTVPAGTYSTQTDALGVDATTLNLLMQTLPEAMRPWYDRAQPAAVGGRFQTPYTRVPATLGSAANPSTADRDRWVDTLLRQGVLFRAPTMAESQSLRTMLDQELTAEGTFDTTKRKTTLLTVASAARLMAGSLFHSEMGTGPGTRRRLGSDELALAFGRFIGSHAVSSTLWGSPPTDVSGNPDWSRPMNADGWLSEVRDAANGGTLADPATLVRLLRRYRGGVDPSRIDLIERYRTDQHDQMNRERGEFWLSEGITSFFREWLEVDNAESSFKDTPEATSQWTTVRSNLAATGYGLATSRFRTDTLLPQLDDTIARAVIEAETSGQDVFRALLTTRNFRVPSNLVSVDRTRPCTTPMDCGDSRAGACYNALGFCAVFGTSEIGRVYNLGADVADTRAARWVTLPANERAGVVTHPAFLAAHGGNFEDDASLVHRGRWIRENLLCTDVPGLERVMVPAMLGARGGTLSARDRVLAATSNDQCIGCHAHMNPYGLAFEIFNHAGFTRAMDHGHAPSGTTTITDSPDPALNRTYADAVEMMQTFADSPWARRCFIRNVFRYFMGRGETPADACTLAAMEQAFHGGSFFALLETLVTSDTFLYRHDSGAAQ